jgi:hypothetical protein
LVEFVVADGVDAMAVAVVDEVNLKSVDPMVVMEDVVVAAAAAAEEFMAMAVVNVKMDGVTGKKALII